MICLFLKGSFIRYRAANVKQLAMALTLESGCEVLRPLSINKGCISLKKLLTILFSNCSGTMLPGFLFQLLQPSLSACTNDALNRGKPKDKNRSAILRSKLVQSHPLLSFSLLKRITQGPMVSASRHAQPHNSYNLKIVRVVVCSAVRQ